MNIVIVGAGRVGYYVAKQLIEKKHDVTIIDKSDKVIRYINDRLDCKTIVGIGNDIDILNRAGLAKANYFICSSDSDEVNLACCYLVNSHFQHVSNVLCLRYLNYSASVGIAKTLSKSSFVIHTPNETAKAIIKAIRYGASGGIYDFVDDAIQMRSIFVTKDSKLIGLDLSSFRRQVNYPFLVSLVYRNNQYIIPTGEITITENDTLYLAAAPQNIEDLLKRYEDKSRPTTNRRIAVLGGGYLGLQVAKELSRNSKGIINSMINLLSRNIRFNTKIKLIEKDYELCKNLSDILPSVEIVNADILDENIFEEENLDTADIFVASTGNSELNMLTALYAKKSGIKRTVVLVHTRNSYNVAEQLGLDVVVSTNNTAISAITGFVHSNNEDKIKVQSIVSGEIEVIEIKLTRLSTVVGKMLKEIKLPPETLITFLYRNGIAILPDGQTYLQEEDKIVLITHQNTAEKVKAIFMATI